jgi:hypothetical protein
MINDFSIHNLEGLLQLKNPEVIQKIRTLLNEVSQGLAHITSVHALADNIQYHIDEESKLLLKKSTDTEGAMLLLLHHQDKNINEAESNVFYGSLEELKGYLKDPLTPQEIVNTLKHLKQRLEGF